MKRLLTVSMLTSAFLTMIVLSTGCAEKGGPEPAEPRDTSPTAASEETPEAPVMPDYEQSAPGTSVVVSVAGNELTEQDVRAVVQRQMQSQRMAGLGQQAQERYRERIKQSVVQRFVDKNVLLEAARENDLAVDESEVEEVMDNIKSGLPEGLTFEDALAQGGMTPTQLQARIEEDLMVEKLVENRLDDVSEVTEADAREFYDENKAQFEAPETVEARHILVKVDPEAGEDAKAEKKAQAELYREELLEGADFAELAKEKSEGPSAQKGGELGVLRRGQTVPEFEEAAFSQEIGKVGPVVETKFGYHIIEVLEKTEAGTTPFEDVKEDIISYLTRQSEQEAIGSYIDKLKGEVEIDYPGGKPQMPQPAAGPMQPQPVPSPSQ